ncbi:MAG TPA: Calx-beta domain-containing protein, partial [Pyrinomonadaceae bacterium]
MLDPKICPKFLSGRFRPRITKLFCTALVAALLVISAIATASSHLGIPSLPYAPSREASFQRARLSEQISVLAAERGDGRLSLQNGRELVSAYKGPAELQQALERREAQARSLASADFDEDGVPDLVSGYAYGAAGIVTIHRGNVDSIYPNAPEAQQRKASGTFTRAPFLSPALAIEVATAADFLGAGDFDADGHWDIVLASRGGKSLYVLPGDGKGNFGSAKETLLNGNLTTFATGEINLRDGLTDIVAGIDGPEGAQALVFEGPAGALRAAPEVLNLPASSTSLALGQLDNESTMDLAVAAGNDLLIVHGRNRKLLPSSEQLTDLPAARISKQTFPVVLRQLALGDFDGDSRTDIGVLLDDGSLSLIRQPEAAGKKSAGGQSLSQWQTAPLSLQRWPGISELVTTRVSTSPADDLVLISKDQQRMHVLTNPGRNIAALDLSQEGTTGNHRPLSLDVDGQPMAVLPMRLNVDALSDLVILRSSSSAPTLAMTGQTGEAATAPLDVGYTTFSNSSPITVTSGFSPPDRATPYPSTITVSGLPGTVDKLRVRLNNMSSNFTPGDFDILLVGPGGQKVMLMSDVSSCCSISNATISFDDDADISLSGIRVITGTYKPTDQNTGTDTFPTPAPAGPYGALLSVFNGTDPNGVWSLYLINDTFSGNSANIAGGWTLYFGPDSPINYVVTNTNDSDTGSLRQAILDANASLGADTISFSIGSGAKTITPASALPNIIEAVTIDGTTQPGFAGMPLIEINGVNTGPFSGSVTGLLHITGGRSVVRGLVLNQFNNSGIALLNSGNSIIEGNFIGTDVTGRLDRGNGDGISIDTANNLVGGTTTAARNLISGMSTGVKFTTFNPELAQQNLVQGNFIGTNITGNQKIANSSGGVTTRSAPGSPNNTIGGLTAGARNIISGNGTNVDLVYTGSTGNLIQGNYIGPNVSGTASIPNNTSTGVSINSGASGNTVGGTTAAARNIISGNLFGGVQIGVSGVVGITNNNLVEGNYIGTDAAGTGALGNGGAGVTIPANANTNLIQNNRIAFNGSDGVQVLNVGDGVDTPGIEDAITDNEIYSNGDLGIDLGTSGITPNDPGDADTGPNNLQNFPVLTDYSFGASGLSPPKGALAVTSPITVSGTLNSTPNTTFTIHWIFSTDSVCVGSQFVTQPLALGKIPGVLTDGSGNASFSFPFDFPPGTSSGVINCEAKDPNGNTSEFSACLPVSATPSISISDFTQSEGNSGTTSFTFTVNLSRTSPLPISVDYATANGTATIEDIDYALTGGTLIFNPGEISKPITVPVNGDNKLEPGETFFVNLSNPTNVTIADGQGLGTITNDDPQPAITINDVSQNEGNTGTTSFAFTATLSNPSYQTVTVNYATSNGTATTTDNDYSSTTGTLTFNPGETSKGISVSVTGDNKFEPNETYFVTLSGATQATIADSQGQGTISNDDLQPTISINDVSQGEGNSGTASFTFTVSLSNPSYQTVAVNYATANDTAIASGDYQTKSGTLTFNPGDMTKTFVVLVNGDTLNEADETFFINLSGNTNSTIADGQGVGTIANDDPVPSFSITDVSVTEGNSGTINATFTASLSAASGQTTTVQYATADGTAAAGDYQSTTGTLTFDPGDTSKSITVVVNGDLVHEPDETFFVNLSNATNATIADNQGVGTITNDDPVPGISLNDVTANEGNSGTMSFGFTVSLSNPSSQTITVNYSTADGTGAAGSDYQSASGTLTFNPGDTSKPISVSVNGDALNESDETFFVNLSGATNGTITDTQGLGTITNDDPVPSLSINDVGLAEGNSGTTNATFTVSLSAASGRTVTVNYAAANGTATVGSDYQSASGILTFNPGETTHQVVVVVNGDIANEIDETFFVNLSGATNATIADTQGAGTILNDDGAPTLSINDLTVTEGNSGTTNATFTVTLSPASGQTVTVQYATADGSALAGSDYQSAGGTITFDPGDTSKPVTVLVNGDPLNEPGETFFVNLSNSTNSTIADNQGMGTIANDDPVPQLSVNDISLAEGNSGTATATFTVSLSAASAQTVSVNYATADGTATTGGDYQSTSGALTFNPGDTSKSITVLVNGDTTFESNETFLVNLTAPINATMGDGQGEGTISNDDSQPAISINDVSQGEGNSGTTSFTFSVGLSNSSSETVTVNYTTADGTAGTANNDYSSSSGTVTFNSGDTSKSITVLINGDALSEADETFFVNLSGAANATIADNQGLGTISN